MSMFTVVIKEPNVTDVEVEDLGITVTQNTSITMSDQFTYFELAGSDDLRTKVNSGDLVVNDGSGDLSSANGVIYLTWVHKKYLADTHYTKTELTNGTVAVHWDNLTNVPSFGDPAWVEPVLYRASSLNIIYRVVGKDLAVDPGTGVLGDVYVDDQGTPHYWECTNATGPVFTDIGAVSASDMIVDLSDGDEDIFTYSAGWGTGDAASNNDVVAVMNPLLTNLDPQWFKFAISGTTWGSSLGDITDGSRVIDLSDSDESIDVYVDSTELWTQGGANLDNDAVTINDDGDGKAAQYVYNTTGTTWVKFADVDFAGHFDGGVNKHDSSEVDVEGTYTYVSVTDLESAIGEIDTELGNLNTQIDGHEDGGANKHDSSEVDVEGSGGYTYISSTDVEGALSDLDSAIGGIDTDTQNTLDESYDEGGSGAGRSITVDSGPVVFDASSGTDAPLRLPPFTGSMPSTNLGSGLLAVKSDILCIYDSSRSKWLSVQRGFVMFGKKGLTKNQYLSFFSSSLPSNNSGIRMERNACIVGISGQLDSSGTCDLRLRKNDSSTNIVTLSLAGVLGGTDITLNVDLSADDFLQSFLNATAPVQDPMIIIEFAWRF